ncbi:MAG: FAD binding domain-containing protein [Rhodospirillales bacterium]
MTPFELAEPVTLKDAIGLLANGEPDVRAVAGGTAVMAMMKTGIFSPVKLVSLGGIEAHYRAIEVAGDGSFSIGAMATLSSLERSPEIARAAPVINQTLRALSNVRVRNVATLGGHLAHADPHMDLPPVLIALRATLTISGPSGERRLNVADLFAGYLETTLAPGELITQVIVPAQGPRRAAYLKCTTRSADDCPALGLAVSLETSGQEITAARIAIGAATETPRRLAGAESALAGTRAADADLGAAGDAAAAEADIKADAQRSAAYKREPLRVYVGRAVRQALSRKSGRGG